MHGSIEIKVSEGGNAEMCVKLSQVDSSDKSLLVNLLCNALEMTPIERMGTAMAMLDPEMQKTLTNGKITLKIPKGL